MDYINFVKDINYVVERKLGVIVDISMNSIMNTKNKGIPPGCIYYQYIQSILKIYHYDMYDLPNNSMLLLPDSVVMNRVLKPSRIDANPPFKSKVKSISDDDSD